MLLPFVVAVIVVFDSIGDIPENIPTRSVSGLSISEVISPRNHPTRCSPTWLSEPTWFNHLVEALSNLVSSYPFGLRTVLFVSPGGKNAERQEDYSSLLALRCSWGYLQVPGNSPTPLRLSEMVVDHR